MNKIAFIGLGVMGYPMAGHLVQSGYDVTVFNRSSDKAKKWVEEYGGQAAQTPAEAAKGADFVMSCVGNDADLRSVTLGDAGAFASMKPKAIYIDHTTASAGIARELGLAAQELGFDFIDAPISGGEAGAQNGVLSIMCGAKSTVFDRAHPVLQAYGKTIIRIGEIGSGQQCKMVNQIAIAGLVQALAEALAFGEKAGLDGQKVLDVISAGAAGSWQMDNRGATMLQREFDFGFAVDWMRKDLGIVLEEASNIGARVDLVRLVDQYYQEVQDMGGGRWDTSSLIQRL